MAEKDTTVLPIHAKKLIAAFKKYDVTYTFIDYPNSNHLLIDDPKSRDRYKQVSPEYLHKAFGY